MGRKKREGPLVKKVSKRDKDLTPIAIVGDGVGKKYTVFWHIFKQEVIFYEITIIDPLIFRVACQLTTAKRVKEWAQKYFQSKVLAQGVNV